MGRLNKVHRGHGHHSSLYVVRTIKGGVESDEERSVAIASSFMCGSDKSSSKTAEIPTAYDLANTIHFLDVKKI